MRILVTGGAGYIGTHTVVALVQAGHEVVVVDNLCNSSYVALERVEQLVGQKIPFYKQDVSDHDGLARVFDETHPDAVMHFAGLKAVGESVRHPLLYYQANVIAALNLFAVMQEKEVFKIIFSSTAAVYGTPEFLPIPETASSTHAESPYARTKVMIEQILTDQVTAHPEWSVVSLRYFNPVGAHPSGTLGEDPLGIPSNLMPIIARIATGRQSGLDIFGDDYDTPDGTAMRDFIHVVDLAEGHVAALQALTHPDLQVFNIGTGKSHSVLEIVQAFEQASGRPIPYVIKPRRPGDVAVSCADARKAARELHWQAAKLLADMCADAWRWQSQNPNGYA